jgi:hypothetical protein
MSVSVLHSFATLLLQPITIKTQQSQNVIFKIFATVYMTVSTTVIIPKIENENQFGGH